MRSTWRATTRFTPREPICSRGSAEAMRRLPPTRERPRWRRPMPSASSCDTAVEPAAESERLMMFEALGVPVVTLERDAAHPERSWWVASDHVPHHVRAARPPGAGGFAFDRAVHRG